MPDNTIPLETETIDRLFLEFSQITKATTSKELFLKRQVEEAEKKTLELCYLIEGAGASPELTNVGVKAGELLEWLRRKQEVRCV
jgi:hypothetical protein